MKRNKLLVRQERSAGGLVYKRKDKKIYWLLGKHSGYHKWVLPKGLIEPNEESWQAAVREVEEEMGVVAKIVVDDLIYEVEYSFMADYSETSKSLGPERRVATYQESGGKQTRVYKKVEFYLMEYVSGDPSKRSWEMEDGGWYLFEEALSMLEFEGEKEVLSKAKQAVERLENNDKAII